MYKVSAPISTFYYGHSLDRDRALAELKRTHTDRVILVAPEILDVSTLDAGMPELSSCISYFESHGFETGIWIGQTIGHGGWQRSGKTFTNIVNINGKPEGSSYCPIDTDFIKTVCDGVKKVALAGAKFIMIDDDFRMGWRSGTVGCFCEKHIEQFRKIIGKQMTREEIAQKVYTGAPSRYRDEWLKLTGNSLAGLAAKMREAADSVDKDIRMGLCACCSTWDIDGIDSYELTKIIAGQTKPFIRLIGAPYWTHGMRKSLANIIELERLERSWTDEDIEIFSEGDTYPRPRYQTPASYLEAFDTALRADGRMDGILKYMFDYTSSFDYETKYADYTEKNQKLYAEIDKTFSGLCAVGVNVVRKMKNLANANLPQKVDSAYITNCFFFPAALQFLTYNSIPITYNNKTCPSIIFGQDAKSICGDFLNNGVILDAPAAIILRDAGIDVGISEIEKACGVTLEHYIEDNEVVPAAGSYYNVKTKDGAKTLSKLVSEEGELTGAYEYENHQGMRFLVYPFDAYESRNAGSVFRCYCRQRQLARSLSWLSGKPFDALCLSSPDLYMMVKKNESVLAIGLWNFFDDSIEKPVITLGKAYKKIELINCDCGYTLEGNTLTLECNIIPYGFVGIRLQ